MSKMMPMTVKTIIMLMIIITVSEIYQQHIYWVLVYVRYHQFPPYLVYIQGISICSLSLVPPLPGIYTGCQYMFVITSSPLTWYIYIQGVSICSLLLVLPLPGLYTTWLTPYLALCAVHLYHGQLDSDGHTSEQLKQYHHPRPKTM